MWFRAWLLHVFNHLMGRPYEYSPLSGEYDHNTVIRITKTTTHQIMAIHAIEKECFSDPWTLRALKNEITHKNSVCLVAINENNMILGHVTMRQVFDEGHINNIAVAGRARRKGIGRQLLEALISESETLGIAALTLEVRSKNHAAISLYEKLGFVTCGKRENYYHTPIDDALIMWRDEYSSQSDKPKAGS